MTETVFNLFLPFDRDDRCDHALYVGHQVDGDDDAALKFLRDRTEEDLLAATRVALPKAFTRSEYYAHIRAGGAGTLYDAVFIVAGAGASPLYVVTPVKDGKVMVNATGQIGDRDIYLNGRQMGDAVMDDWLLKYTTDEGIDLPSLINDDYFLAIKLTFDARHYVSSLKLLLSCIDSLAYVEYGDQPSIFVNWLRTYADLTPVGITPEELWELRNGVLHMTNLSSRQVVKKKVRRITVRIGGAAHTDADGTYFFDFHALIQTYAAGLNRWIASYNTDRDKFAKFIERYDETISDSRLLTRPQSSAITRPAP